MGLSTHAHYGFDWDLKGGTLLFLRCARCASFARSEELYLEQKSVSMCVYCKYLWSLLYYVCDHVPLYVEELIVGIGWFYALLMDFLIGT